MDKETARQFERLAILSDDKKNHAFLRSLDQKLAINPNDLKLKHLQAMLYRKNGQLNKAKQVYQTLLMSDPVMKQAQMGEHTVIPTGLEGNEGFSVAPLFLQDDFLNKDSIEVLLNYAINNKARFSWEKTNNKAPKYNPDKRKTLRLWDIEAVKTLFENKLKELIPQACLELAIPRFNVEKMEIKMTNHLDGYFFQVHHDNDALFGKNTSRVFTWLYYFHQQPKAFEGGDLLVFDTNFQCDHYNEAAFSKIKPKHNRLVAFPSCFYHAVSPVRLASDDFAKGRFALSCHVHYDNKNRDNP